ncbi:protein phosphatase 1 regulatory subunit 12A-like isoform X3 [Dreissena polymorpha]|uniref:protein phosphatase 1 regulatory subunit 12A-like isoform X3 n=1 Tax=Dreissena polymorpha TaxID=45954 RepID=UPI002263B727|nr:protein phosphatase 1 regulatory subunit 12A-like isoform X3 [Dreissena polymorpha]
MSFFNLGLPGIGKEQDLLDAARVGNLSTVVKLLSSIKHDKAKRSKVDRLTSFLKTLNINITDKNGYTPLHQAAVNGHRDIVEALLKADAEPGLEDNQGCTPVHLASWSGNPEIVMQLLNAGTQPESAVEPVQVNHQNKNGDTALHSAAQYGHVAVVDVLLQKSANPTIRNIENASPLDLAAQYGRLDVVKRLLISHPELANRPSSVQSPLHLASRNGHTDVVSHLLDNKFDIQTKTEYGTALHEAALHGKLDCVRLLLGCGVDVNARDGHGQTALELVSAHCMKQKSFTEITKAIADHIERSSPPPHDIGLYESLAACRSGSESKPTAAVRPITHDPTSHALKPTTPSPSLKPRSPSLKPRSPSQREASKPSSPSSRSLSPGSPTSLTLFPSVQSRPTTLDQSDTLSGAPDVNKERPIPAPRMSLIQLTPEDESSTPLYALPAKDNPVECVVPSPPARDVPPLPPRQSVFSIESRSQAIDKAVEKSKSNIPKKPPRKTKPVAPHLDLKIASSETSMVQHSPPPNQNVSLPVMADSAVPASQHSTQHSDQSHFSIDDSCDSSSTKATDATKPSYTDCQDGTHCESKLSDTLECSANPKTCKTAVKSVNLQMNKPKSRPVSEVKPQVHSKEDSTTETKVDNYGILFPNLTTKMHKDSNKEALSATGDEYVVPSTLAEDGKQKKTVESSKCASVEAADETAYMPMSGCGDELDGSADIMKEHDYCEISENSPSEGSECSLLYSSIDEVSQSGKATEKASSVSSAATKKATLPALTDRSVDLEKGIGHMSHSKPLHLDFRKGRVSGHTPLTPTGYHQPPTPDFPPPSPATALLGIEKKIKQMDSKRKSRDGSSLTDTLAEYDAVSKQGKGAKVKVTDTEPEISKVQESDEEKAQDTNSGECKDKSEAAVIIGAEMDKAETEPQSVASDDGKQRTVIDQPSSSIPESSIPVQAVIGASDSVKDAGMEKPQVNSKPFRQRKPVDGSASMKALSGDSANKDTEHSDETSEAYMIEAVTEDKSIEEICKTVDNPGNTGDSVDESKPVERSTSPKGSGGEPISQGSVSPEVGSLAPEKATLPLGSTMSEGSAMPQELVPPTGSDSPIVMRRPSRSSADRDLDVFKGLFRGSNIGTPRKDTTSFYQDVLNKNRVQSSVQGASAKMDSADDIDVDAVMKSMDVEITKRASASHESSSFDDAEEWEKIQGIMASFGSSIARESIFIKDIESKFMEFMSGEGQILSVGEWLESLGLNQYENNFIANGFDNIDFLDPRVLEEQDLEQIGVLSHPDRCKILQSAKTLPHLKPIDNANPPKSVEEWLMSLQLLDHLETFRSHGYDTIEKVQSILWELQLRTVLDISMLGHRKRILASLGERKPIERQSSQITPPKKPSLTSPTSEPKSPLDINLYKDYSKVKPVSTSDDDSKPTQMVLDPEEEEEVFKKRSGQSIRNSTIHLRPPHLAQTSSPARQWRHKPEMLIKGCCNYTAQYLGSTLVQEITGGVECTKAGITKLKRRFVRELQKSTDMLAKVPIIMLSISYKGVKFIDAKSKKVICDHEIGNIFCACQDSDNLNFFAYITRDIQTVQHYCHVFSVKSSSLAHDIILTLGESFEVAYQLAMKERSLEEAMAMDQSILEQTISCSDTDDSMSLHSTISTSTV